MTCLVRLPLICCLALVLWLTPLASGQEGGTPPPAAVPSASDADAEGVLTAGLEAALAEARQRLESLPADADEAQRTDLQRIVTFLERRLLLRGQAASIRAGLADLEESEAQLSDALAAMRRSGPEGAGPWTVLEVDAVRDELDTAQSQVEASAATVEAATLGLADARRQAEAREAARRKAQEAADAASDPASARALRLAEQEAGVAVQTVAVREAELRRAELNRALLDLRIETLGERLRWMRADMRFTEAHLREHLSEIEARRTQYQRQLENAEGNARFAETAWFNARTRLSDAGGENAELRTEVEARQVGYEAAKEEVDALTKAIERLGDEETAWQRRYAVTAQPPELETLREWEGEAESRIAVLETERRLDAARLDEVRGRVSVVAAQVTSIESSSSAADPGLRWLRRQRDGLRDLAAALEGRLVNADAALATQRRLVDEIGRETSLVSVSERVQELWAQVTSIWSFPLTSIDEQPITIGKIVIGLVILLFGLLSSRFLSRMLGRRVLPRLKLNEGAAAAVQSILFYVLIITFTLFAFRAVNIPLTAFTVLGGALAIGVGFGSQNIINNFISGLIMLAERPVRVGDLIEVADLHATVEHIGARSTRVRTGDNIEVIIPNSTFLEQNVINWTLSEDRVRTRVVVGVAYGSPTRDVARLLRKAAEDHGRVLKSPEPIVLFADFGDSALVFEVHFWIRMRAMMQRRIIESDIRHRIDNLFDDAGIVIAFPQRDIHVMGGGPPIEVRMAAEEKAAGDDA
ncbi:MAG: mechanosensitive ion channel [Phycisphaerales bacterium]|nr:mechanosensitive ion channel [Phycisphaerales bacterium]